VYTLPRTKAGRGIAGIIESCLEPSQAKDEQLEVAFMKRVFVSYSRHNVDEVTRLIHDLNAVGVDTWHDQTLTGGQRWWDSILANIRESEIFISALSPESLESEACKSELFYAERLGKPVLPVVVAEGVNVNLLPKALSQIQYTDCRSGDKESIFALLKSIMSTPQSPPLPDPLPAAPAVPISYLGNLNDRIESPEPLSSQDQITLLFELEEARREGRSPTEVRDLLLRLKRRDDLLAKIAIKIDAALAGLDASPDVERKPITPEASAPPRQEPGRRDYRPASEQRLCAQCNTKIEPGSKFCKNCGAPVSATGRGPVPPTSGPEPPPEEDLPTVPGSKTHKYICAPADTARIITDVKGWLESQSFDSQQVRDSKGVLLQIKKRGAWRDFVGMSTSLNILFHQAGETLIVQIGAGKWIDKAAAGAVSLLILWPLAITAGYGAWEQTKMPEKIFEFIGSRLAYR